MMRKAFVAGSTTVMALALVVGLSGPAQSNEVGGIFGDSYPEVDEYVVVAGDTLWDVCGRVLGHPELWPRVWALNPEITNPHWIYPGDLIRFYRSSQPLPSLYDAVAGVEEIAAEDEGDEEMSALDLDDPAVPRGPPIEVISLPKATVVDRASRPHRVFVGVFLTPQELQEAGKLTNAAPDKVLLAPGDQVYLKFPKGKVPGRGMRFMVYRTIGEVEHPINGKFWGYMTQVTGVVEVTSFSDEVAYARVIEAVTELERGQLVTPLVEHPLRTVTPSKASTKVTGVVVAVQADRDVFVSEGQLVFIDKGKRDGVARGHRFNVFRKGDAVAEDGDDLGRVLIGTLMVVDTKEHASTCLVVRAVREITPGDSIQTL